jgi:hypothetical protein
MENGISGMALSLSDDFQKSKLQKGQGLSCFRG